MRTTQYATIAVVTMLLLAGVAAVGAAAPAETANENATASASNPPGDAADERASVGDERPNVSDQHDAGANGENASNAEAGQGLGHELPATVPDHVSQIHDTIAQYLDGDIENLGHALGDLLSGEAADAVNDSAANASVDAANASAADDANESGDNEAVNETTDQATSAATLGPSDGLPTQVPDHVSDIHETIDSFLNGATDNLGHALSDLLGTTDADESSD